MRARGSGTVTIWAREDADAFPRDRLRSCHHHLFYRQAMRQDQLVEQSRAFRVDVQEAAEIGHVILVGGEVKYKVDAYQRRRVKVSLTKPIGMALPPRILRSSS